MNRVALGVIAGLMAAGCEQHFEDVTLRVKQLQDAQVLDNSSLCSTIWITNEVVAQVFSNGTAVNNTGETSEVDLVNPKLTYTVFNSSTTLPAYDGEVEVGADLLYGSNASIDIPLNDTTLVNPYYTGKITTTWHPKKNKRWDDNLKTLTYPIKVGSGEGRCGFIYFYVFRDISYYSSKSGPQRFIANQNPGVEIIAYDVREDLGSNASTQEVSDRIIKIKAMIASISNRPLTPVIAKMSMKELKAQKREFESISQATARALAVKKMKEFDLPRSEKLADAVSEYIAKRDR